jgi:hypothetical protein
MRGCPGHVPSVKIQNVTVKLAVKRRGLRESPFEITAREPWRELVLRKWNA